MFFFTGKWPFLGFTKLHRLPPAVQALFCFGQQVGRTYGLREVSRAERQNQRIGGHRERCQTGLACRTAQEQCSNVEVQARNKGIVYIVVMDFVGSAKNRDMDH